MSNIFLTVLLSILFSLSFSKSFEVTDIKDTLDFERSLTTVGVTVSLFYEADGSYSEEVEEFFDKLSQYISEQKFPKLRFFRVNVRDHRVLSRRAEITTFPALTIFVTQKRLEHGAISIHVEPKNFDPENFASLFLSKNNESLKIQDLPISVENFISQHYLESFDTIEEERQRESIEKQKKTFFNQRNFHSNIILFNDVVIKSINPSESEEDKPHLYDLISQSSTDRDIELLVESHFGNDYNDEFSWFAQTHKKVSVFRVNCRSHKQFCSKLSVTYDPSLSYELQPRHYVAIKNGKYISKSEQKQPLSNWFESLDSNNENWNSIDKLIEGLEKVQMKSLTRIDPNQWESIINENKNEIVVIGHFSRNKIGMVKRDDKIIYTIYNQIIHLFPSYKFYDINTDLPSSYQLSKKLRVENTPSFQIIQKGKVYTLNKEFEDNNYFKNIKDFIEREFHDSPSFDLNEVTQKDEL